MIYGICRICPVLSYIDKHDYGNQHHNHCKELGYRNAGAPKEKLVGALSSFVGAAAQFDDTTMLAFTYHGTD
ncbi:MAG: hypothetical protein K5848_00050 [Lachnospiraceae bacterium]|nr:hypothetical protein [Lachnospiraceae bacterium]